MAGKSSGVSLQEIADAAGVSKAAVGFALNNQPGVSKDTRERIRQIAKQLGHVPDARVSSVMTTVRASRSKEVLPIAWLNTNSDEAAWRKFKFHSPYLEGARESILKRGYRLDEIWACQRRMTMKRISTILYQRGIEGVIITYPAKHFRLKWDKLAAVSIEGGLMAPRLHRVVTDHFFNVTLALKMLKRSGYRRIGIAAEHHLDRLSGHSVYAAAQAFVSSVPQKMRVPPLIYADNEGDEWKKARRQISDWIKTYRPEVIVCQTNWMLELVHKTGLRVPDDIGIVHLATDDDVADWAGVCSNRREIGAAAAEWVISLVQSRQFGLPRTALNATVRGIWRPGWTLAAR